MADPTPPPSTDHGGSADEGVALVPTAVLDEVFGDGRPGAERYVELLANEGITWGLVGPRERERLWERHVLNSVAVASLIPTGSEVLDVGSGAGLPGIPLALARPDLQITLLEPLLRRVEFLELVVEELELADRVRVLRGRAEELSGRRFEVVTCRAVAGLGKLLGWCWPLVGREMLAIKGASAADEVKSAAKVLDKRGLDAEVLSVRAHGLSDPTTVVRVRRVIK